MDTDGGNNGSRSAAAEAARRKVLAVYRNSLQNLQAENDFRQRSNPQDNNYIAPPQAIYSDSSTTTNNYPSQTYDELTPEDFAKLNNEDQDLDNFNNYAEYDSLDYNDYDSRPSYLNNITNSETLKDSPINQTNVDEKWQEYHSAWQQYYQKYYSDYYAQAAQRYLETEKLKNERVAAGKIHRKKRTKRLIPVIVVGVAALIVLFLQYNRLLFAPIMAYVSPDTGSVATSIEAVDPNVNQTVSPEPRLLIPKLNIDVPVAFNINYNDVMDAMNRGVAQFSIPGANALPGQIGNLVISGHSAGDIYSSNPYKFIFSGLERLVPGDLIYINYESVRYTYQVTGSETVEPSNVQALIYETDKPMLTLITCTPLGTSRYRLLVSAEQISPSYTDATTPEENPSGSSEDYSMPANAPSFFENIFGRN